MTDDDGIGRRLLLASTTLTALAWATGAAARTIQGGMEWFPNTAAPPTPVSTRVGVWSFFTRHEATTMEAIVRRLIPGNALGPSGADAGCAVFIDRQLAGDFGKAAWRYMDGPFQDGTPQQWIQSKLTPAEQYRIGLQALDEHCQRQHSNPFVALRPQDQDTVLHEFEDGSVNVPGISGKLVFELFLDNAMEGFFADPIYGGNRDMVGWKLIGFPGARYDYRDFVERHNEPYPLPPVSILASYGKPRD